VRAQLGCKITKASGARSAVFGYCSIGEPEVIVEVSFYCLFFMTSLSSYVKNTMPTTVTSQNKIDNSWCVAPQRSIYAIGLQVVLLGD